MPPFLPPDTGRLQARLSALNQRRLARVMARLRPATQPQRDAMASLRACARSLRGAQRRGFLLRPDVRAWLCAAEEALALSRPPGDDRRFFEVVASGAHLATVLPRGRLDAAARRRAEALGRRLTERAFRTLPALLAFLPQPGARGRRLPVDLAPDGEEGRAEGEVHLWHPAPATLRPPAGARLELVEGVPRIRGAGAAAVPPLSRPAVPGTGIVVARRAVSTPRGLRPGARVHGLEGRLARALRLLREAWEEGYEEVLAHTRAVVPLRERGTVSFSQTTRPGVSYINVEGKSIVDLADDLLHETAHHRLHGLEETAPLVRSGDAALYHSAWRGTPRPVRGILHACYTFTWRAELLARLLGIRRRLRRRWIREELRFELDALRRSLADLARARRAGLLTPAGARLCRAVAARLARLEARPSEPRRRRGDREEAPGGPGRERGGFPDAVSA